VAFLRPSYAHSTHGVPAGVVLSPSIARDLRSPAGRTTCLIRVRRPAVLSLGPGVHPAVHLRGSDARRLLPERRGWCPRPLAFGGDPCCGALLRGWPRPRCGRLRPRARTFSVGSRPGPPRIWHGHRDPWTYFSRTGHARVAELADAVDSKSTDESLVGSTPTPGTTCFRGRRWRNPRSRVERRRFQ
jgi:hypothetical protein